MAATNSLEVRYYPQLDDTTVVFSAIWGLVNAGTTDPIEHNPSEAYFDIIQDDIAYLSLKLNAGLTWDVDAKSFNVVIYNNDLNFVTEDTTFDYKLYVVWDFGQAQTIREGTVNAVVVA